MIQTFNVVTRGRVIQMLLDIELGRLFSDQVLAHYLRHHEIPEPEFVHLLFRALKPGDTAVDAGANVGFFTILMSKLVGPKGHVVAIEPDSRNLVVLRKNLDINDCKNVEIIDQPLGAESGALMYFHEDDENGQSHVAATGTPCRAITLADILDHHVPALLKLDIEGSEYEAIRGLDEYPHRIPTIVAEVNPAALKRVDSSPKELIGELFYRGYMPHELRVDGGLPAHINHRHQEIRIVRPNTNMLFCSTGALARLWPEVEL